MCESTNIKTFEFSKQLVIHLPTYLLTYVRTAIITSNNITVSYILGKVWFVDYLASFYVSIYIYLYVKTEVITLNNVAASYAVRCDMLIV